MAVIETGSDSVGKANIDAGFNLNVTLPQVTTPADVDGTARVGAARLFTENDPGTITGLAYLKSPETSPDYRLRVGTDTILSTDTFNSLTQNTNDWEYIFVTMTAAQPGAGTLNFGVVQGTAATHGALMRSYQYYPLIGTAPLAVELTFGQFTAALVTNEEFRAGLGRPTVGGTAPVDGVWVKLTSAGLIGEIAYNGSLTQSGVLANIGSFVAGELYKVAIIVGEREVEFWKDDVLLGEMAIPAANGQPFIQASLPVFMQKLCTGVVSNTNTMRVSDITVSLLDVASNKPWAHQLAGAGMGSNIGQDGHTQGKTSLWANSGAPTAAAITNTTAAFSGLGGIMSVLPTLAVSSDGILISYQNPVPTINITGRNLIITGVVVQGGVSVILAGGPVLYAYAIAHGHTAVSLATAETASFATATTHSPRIVPIGMSTFPATAAVGTLGSVVERSFESPIVVRPGEFIQVIARNLGVVTTTGAITHIIGFDGYWE